MFNNWLKTYNNINLIGEAKNCIGDFKEIICNKKIIFYGAGLLSNELYNLFIEFDIKVAFFIDRKKKGENIQKPEYLRTLSDITDYIFIAAVNSNNKLDIINDLAKLEITGVVLHDGYQIQKRLKQSKCIIKFEDDTKKFDFLDCQKCANRVSCKTLLKCVLRIRNCKISENSPRLDKLTYFLGTKCNLNCEFCSDGIPYVLNRYFVPKNTVIEDIRKIAAGSVFIPFISLTGGESFLHPDLYDILEAILGISNVGFIYITTNGTVTLSNNLIDILSNERIAVQLSKYELNNAELVDNFNKTVEILEENKILYWIKSASAWFDYTSFKYFNYDKFNLENRYSSCELKTECHGASNGVYYLCLHDYIGEITGKFTENKDRVQIKDFETDELKSLLDELHKRKYIEACKYCEMPFNCKIVPVAEQVPI